MSVMSGAGSLLIATPLLRDDNFFRSVVLIVEHDEGGALGLVLNRPGETPVDDALPQWHGLASPPAVVHVGGPVAPTAAICLARRSPDREPPGWQELYGPVGALDPDTDRDDVAAAVTRLRVFAGYAGWSAGQLDSEISEGAWLVVDGLPDDPFAANPETLWRSVLRRQRGELAMLATFPDDPTLN